jgi:pimeloyl-ACP methyl ester carboxylesterase
LYLLTAAWLAWVALVSGRLASAQDAKLPDEDDIELRTKDDVLLHASYFPPAKDDEKETVPVLLLHGFKGSRADFHELALALQAAGHAVLVPDLRGHGDSQEYMMGGDKKKFDLARFGRNDFAAMTRDVEACKSFLREQHDAGKLNIDRLTIVAAELGAVVALNWAAFDWAQPVLPGVGKKQGQWVKAIVLLSPISSMKGYSIQDAMRSNAIQEEIAMYVLHGRKSKDAAKIAKQFERYRPDPPPPADGEEPEIKNLVVRELDTTLESTKLLTQPELEVAARIGQFIDVFVAKKPEFAWKDWSIR